jgi:hypothetical protein
MSIPELSRAPSPRASTADQFPLSFNQEFLCMFDKGDGEGPFGPEYNIVCGWRITGRLDIGAIRGALDDLVVRHEALRTAIVRTGPEKCQQILPPSSPHLAVRDMPGVDPAERDSRAEDLLIELEAGAYGISDYPLVRAVLGRFDEDDSVLVFVAHHTAVDEWSMQLLIRDFAGLYAARRGKGAPELPEPRQYREFAIWERERANSPAVLRAREYWREKLSGTQFTATRTDKPRSANIPKGTSAHRFLIDAEVTSAALGIAKATRSSPFIVLLAGYLTYLREITGATDLTVPTLAAGRTQARFDQTVGSFFSLVPLRTDLAGCRTFRDVVARTRATCIEAYSHALSFPQIMAEAPELMTPFAGDETTVFSFQVFQFPFVMNHERIGDIEYSDIRRRLKSQAVTTDVPDGGLWTLDVHPDGDMVCSLWFNSNLFDQSGISAMESEFRRVLRDAVTAPDAALAPTRHAGAGPGGQPPGSPAGKMHEER